MNKSRGQKSTYNSEEDTHNEMDRSKISEWEVVLGAPDRVNIPCLMHDTSLCHLAVIMPNN